MTATAPEYALAFMGQFGAVQDACASLYRKFLRANIPSLADFIDERVRRLSDAERIRVVTDIAGAVGGATQFAAVPEVYFDMKELRDDIGHSTTTVPNHDGIWVFRNPPGRTLSREDLYVAWVRSTWLAEQVAYISALAGFHTYSGEPLRRESGVSLPESPPPRVPPTEQAEDPVLWWVRLKDGEIM